MVRYNIYTMDELLDLKIPVAENDHMIGNPTAAVTLVEYGDYECPDCLNSEPMVQKLREQFGDQLRVVFRHYPRNSIHPRASAAAQAAEAAAAQGKFWEYHRALYRHQRDLADLDLTHLALESGMDPYKFQRDSETGTSSRRVRTDFDGAEQSGVKRTPTFFVNGRRHDGKNDLQTLTGVIEKQLSGNATS